MDEEVVVSSLASNPTDEQIEAYKAAKEVSKNIPIAQQYNVQLANLPFLRMLTFPCHGLRIDNYTNQWIFDHGGQNYIAPYCLAANTGGTGGTGGNGRIWVISI